MRRISFRFPAFACLLALTLALGVVSLRAEDGVLLPVWSESDALHFQEPGSVLLGGGLWPVELQPIPEPNLGERPEGFAADPSGRGAGLNTEINVPRIVIRRGGMGDPGSDSDGEFAWGPTGVVPDKFHSAYFGSRPRALLVDVQRLLSEQKTNDLSRFLGYHDGESEITIYALIFGGRQELPPGVSLRDLHEKWFPGEQVVLMAYFLGEPKHAILEFGRGATESLGRNGVGEILEMCIDEARVAQNAFNQLERFCIELSIRLYWIERTNATGGAEAVAEAGAASSEDKGLEAAERGKRLFTFLSLFGCVVALAGLGWILWHYSGFASRAFVFPIEELVPRLSAPHSGGAHAVMYFGKKGAG